MPRRLASRRRLRQLDELAEARLLVHQGGVATRVAPALELRQKDAHHPGLNPIEARVPTHLGVRLLVLGAVEAQAACRCPELVVVRDDRTAIAHAREVLGWEE